MLVSSKIPIFSYILRNPKEFRRVQFFIPNMCIVNFLIGFNPLFISRALFRSHQSSKFFHSLSITSIFSRLHGVLNVGKKKTNYTV